MKCGQWLKEIIWLFFSDLHGINDFYFGLKELMRAVPKSMQYDMSSNLTEKQSRKGSDTIILNGQCDTKTADMKYS